VGIFVLEPLLYRNGSASEALRNPVRGSSTFRWKVELLVAPPMRLDKKDAKKKTRDFLGFSSFFVVFLTFLKIGF
jgi:hypothetical protein